MRNSSKVSMKNDTLDFNMITFFFINTRSGKVLRPLLVRWEFPLSGWVKINTDGVVRGILVLLLVEVFSVGVWGSLLVFSLCFLKFRLLWLLSFMELYMLWRKLNRLTNVWLKCDSVLVCASFTTRTNVSWWNICWVY